jgi:hypothetical protein
MYCNTEKKENLAALHSAKIPDGHPFFMKMLLIRYKWIIFITGLLKRKEIVLAFLCVIY